MSHFYSLLVVITGNDTIRTHTCVYSVEQSGLSSIEDVQYNNRSVYFSIYVLYHGFAFIFGNKKKKKRKAKKLLYITYERSVQNYHPSQCGLSTNPTISPYEESILPI